MAYNATRKDREAQARSDLATKIKLEGPVARSFEEILNSIAKDFQAFLSVTGQIFDSHEYDPEVKAALTTGFNRADDEISGRLLDFVEDNPEDGVSQAVALLAVMAGTTVAETIDDIRQEMRVANNRFINTQTTKSTLLIGDTTNRQLGEQVTRVQAEAMENGERLTQRALAARAADRFRSTIKGRASTIAATEIQTAVEGIKQTETDTFEATIAPTTMAGTTRTNYVKEWVTQGDEVVRPAHVQADSQQRPIEQPYLVGGENLMYPGDPAGSPGNIINCRCDSQITFDIDITQQGREVLNND